MQTLKGFSINIVYRNNVQQVMLYADIKQFVQWGCLSICIYLPKNTDEKLFHRMMSIVMNRPIIIQPSYIQDNSDSIL